MGFSEDIPQAKQRDFLKQGCFAKEGGKARTNLAAMKSVKEFCLNDMIFFH